VNEIVLEARERLFSFMTDESTLWERQEHDTPRSWEAFVIYRDMGAERSLVKAWVAYRTGMNQGQNRDNIPAMPGYFKDWSSTHNWQKRVKAYDEYLAKKEREKREALREKIIEDELTDYDWQLTLWRKVMSSAKLHEISRGEKLPDGTLVKLVELLVNQWYTLTRWRDDISRQGRRALGMPDRITQEKVDTGIEMTILHQAGELIEQQGEDVNEVFGKMIEKVRQHEHARR